MTQNELFPRSTAMAAVTASAFARRDTTAEIVFEAIQRRGQDGVVADILLAQLNPMPYSTVTANFSKLQKKGLIYYRGDKVTGKSGRRQRVIREERRVAETIGFLDCRRAS